MGQTAACCALQCALRACLRSLCTSMESLSSLHVAG